MNHYAVSRPDGHVLGYGCSTCDRLQILSGRYGTSADAAEAAARCCTCDVCGCSLPWPRSGSWCDFCYWLDCFSCQWLNIGRAQALGVSNRLVWAVVMEQYDYGPYMSRIVDAWDVGYVRNDEDLTRSVQEDS